MTSVATNLPASHDGDAKATEELVPETMEVGNIRWTTQELVKVATCNLDQWALDFDGNLERTMKAIRIARERGCKILNGPELQLAGYGCEDHFLEPDTFMHSWQSMASILASDCTEGILCSIGMPVMFNSTSYNCAVWVLDRKIILIRPKLVLANDGNYREPRWFTAWTRIYDMEKFHLPRAIYQLTGQETAPFGAALLVCKDAVVATETCEEMFSPDSPHIQYSLNGAEIICNGSGSHHNLRKLEIRINLITNASSRCGCAYLYANQQGCDGGRLYFDGCAMIVNNGRMLAQGDQFSVFDVQVIDAVIDLSVLRARRNIPSYGVQADSAKRLPTVEVDFWLTAGPGVSSLVPTEPRDIRVHPFQEEIALGPSCWLWDYLRRSGASGFFLPLSGGADSSSTAALVGIMCQSLVKAVRRHDEQVISDIQRIVGLEGYTPEDPRELCNRLFSTCYMGTVNSSDETRDRARQLAEEIGSLHLDVNIDALVDAMIRAFEMITGKVPQYSVRGGTTAENLALQNIQARLRMVLSYMLSQLLPWTRGQTGWLLVLGSANVDEGLRGYYTKYDCSSADINPIGGICKNDLKEFLLWCAGNDHEIGGFPCLRSVVEAKPTAELEPITDTYAQEDEVDMGMTYEELGIYGRLRNIVKCGPVSMYASLVNVWTDKRDLSATDVAKKVKDFFTYYGRNRHKQTTVTPSYHAENYSPDDNRFDHRQFLYPSWTRQFDTIDKLAAQHDAEKQPRESSSLDHMKRE